MIGQFIGYKEAEINVIVEVNENVNVHEITNVNVNVNVNMNVNEKVNVNVIVVVKVMMTDNQKETPKRSLNQHQGIEKHPTTNHILSGRTRIDYLP